MTERKKTVIFILATGAFGFIFLALVSFLLSRPHLASLAGEELVAAGLVGLATGIFLIVAIIAVWFDKSWVGRWSD